MVSEIIPQGKVEISFQVRKTPAGISAAIIQPAIHCETILRYGEQQEKNPRVAKKLKSGYR